MSESIDISRGFTKAKIVEIDTESYPPRYLVELPDKQRLWFSEKELDTFRAIAARVTEYEVEDGSRIEDGKVYDKDGKVIGEQG